MPMAGVMPVIVARNHVVVVPVRDDGRRVVVVVPRVVVVPPPGRAVVAEVLRPESRSLAGPAMIMTVVIVPMSGLDLGGRAGRHKSHQHQNCP